MPVSSSEGTRLYQRKTSKQSARFFPLVFRKQGNRSQDGVSVKYLIMRGSIYYAHKESSLLPWASIFSFFLFFWFFSRSEERTCLQSLHTPPSPCLHPNGNSFSLAPPKPPRGLGVKGVRQYRQRPNEFLSSRLLPEPSITAAWSGETRRRRLCPGGGGAGGGGEEKRGRQRGQRVFSALRDAEEAPSPRSFRVPWVGSGSPTRLPAEMVARN